jgi:hypothetical protein
MPVRQEDGKQQQYFPPYILSGTFIKNGFNLCLTDKQIHLPLYKL